MPSKKPSVKKTPVKAPVKKVASNFGNGYDPKDSFKDDKMYSPGIKKGRPSSIGLDVNSNVKKA